MKSFESTKGFIFDQLNREGAEYRTHETPPQQHFEQQTVLASVDESYTKPVVSFALPEKKFIAQESGLGAKDINWQSLIISLDFRSEFEYPGHTLKPPYVRALNEFYSREVVFDPWKLRVEDGGIGIIEECNTASIRLYPIPHQSLIERLFKFAGITAKHSQAGLLASQIIEKMNDNAPMEACRVFKVRRRS